MIQKLNQDSIYLERLEELFTNVFTLECVKKDILNNQFTNYFTYLIDNKPVAFINYFIMYERAELININVEENFQNRGIASILLDYMIKDCAQKKVNSITLEVNSTNQKALHLYQKFGFTQIAIRKGYYQGTDAVLMEKELV